MKKCIADTLTATGRQCEIAIGYGTEVTAASHSVELHTVTLLTSSRRHRLPRKAVIDEWRELEPT